MKLSTPLSVNLRSNHSYHERIIELRPFSDEENLNDEFKQLLIKEHGFHQSVKIKDEVCNLPASTLIKIKTTKENVMEIVTEVCEDLASDHDLEEDLLERCFITEVSVDGILFVKGKSYKS